MADDYSSDPHTTGVLTPNAPVQGAIEVADDNDWLKVHLDAGQTYVFDLQGLHSGGGTLDTNTAFPSGMSLRPADGTDLYLYSAILRGEPQMSYAATATGDYYVIVHSDGAHTGSYTLVETLTEADVTAPLLLSSTLTSGAVNVGVKPQFVLTFDEIVRPGYGITLTDSNGVAVEAPFGHWLVETRGDQLIVNPRVNLMPGMTYTLSLPAGSVVDTAGNQAAAQNYSFTITPAVPTGTPGNDYLIGGRGDALNGGAGTDTVYYGFERGWLKISHNADGTVAVRDNSDKIVNELSGVERLLFTDGAMAIDTDGVAGQLFRLYQSAFHRTPAPDGLGFWMAAMDSGTSLNTVTQNFLASQEFANLYGNAPTDAEFVHLLYSNVLHRDPLPAGYAFWIDGLAHGATRAEVLTAFSESAENTAAMAASMANGLWYTPYG